MTTDLPSPGHYQQFDNQIASGFNEFSPAPPGQFDAGAGIFAPKPQYQYQGAQASPSPAHSLEGAGRPQDWSYPASFPIPQESTSSFTHGGQTYGSLAAYDYQAQYVDPMFGMNGFGVGGSGRPPASGSPLATSHPEAPGHPMGGLGGQPMLDEALNMLRSHDDNGGAVGAYGGGLGPGPVKRKPGSLDSLAMDQQPSSSTSARGRPRSKKSKKQEDAEMEEDGSIDGEEKIGEVSLGFLLFNLFMVNEC